MAAYPTDILTGTNGAPIAGVLVTVTTKSGVLASLTNDDGSVLANPFVTGVSGAVHFNVPDPGDVYTINYRYGGRLLRTDSAIIGVPVSFSLSALFTLPTGVASTEALKQVMTNDQFQLVGDAISYLPVSAPASLIWNGEFAQQTDALGQLLGQTLFGSTSDGQLTALFNAATAATIIPYNSTLTPVEKGAFVVSG